MLGWLREKWWVVAVVSVQGEYRGQVGFETPL